MDEGGSMAAAAPAAWRLRLHGPAQLLAPDGRAWVLDRLAAFIAARLALAGPQPRELLARQLWPDVDDARARGNLRQRLLRLKAQAGWAWIDGSTHLRLHPQVLVDLDASGVLLEGLQPRATTHWLTGWKRSAAPAGATRPRPVCSS